MMTNHAIVLFDGVCNLCTWSVQFILQRDPRGYFKFSSMQSESGRKLMEDHGVPSENMDTFVLLAEPTVAVVGDNRIAPVADRLGDRR